MIIINFLFFNVKLLWPEDKWERVVFCDEKTFSNGRSGHKLVRKQRSEPMPDFTQWFAKSDRELLGLHHFKRRWKYLAGV